MTDYAEQINTKTHSRDEDRRASIQEIMKDNRLTPFEKRRSIQSLMDGRRRSSTPSSSDDSVDTQPDDKSSECPYPRARRSVSLTTFGAIAAAVAAATITDNPGDTVNTARRIEKRRPQCTHTKDSALSLPAVD